jgi:glycosyltransferase involved in cell wall biosynthesis
MTTQGSMTTGGRGGNQPHRFVVAQLGARGHYAVASILHSKSLLERLCTDICANTAALTIARKLIPRRLRWPSLARLLARVAPGIPRTKIRCFPRILIRKALCRTRPGEQYRTFFRGNREFCRQVVKRGLAGANAVYVFNAAALEILEYAKRHGMLTILEQICAPLSIEQRLVQEERDAWPGWDPTSNAAADWGPLAEREVQEWPLCDRIVCGSQYVLEGIAQVGGPVDRCAVVPYGMDPGSWSSTDRGGRSGALRVLFVGTVGLRKGVQYLLKAADLLPAKDFEFRIVGPSGLAELGIRELRRRLDVVGNVARDEVQREYHWADVLALPSISEGSANVCYEALACGLPVITTPNAGSVVRDGVDGYVVPIRSPEALADRLQALAANRRLLAEFSGNALERAGCFTWDQWRDGLLECIRSASASAGLPPTAAPTES